MKSSHAIQIIDKSMQKVHAWSGGTTTELAIFPEGANYAKRDFKWRISTAVVDEEESVFTSLPGIWRILMVIEGDLYLEHDEFHRVHLKPYEQDQFSGDWHTKSIGIAKDFNMMLSAGYTGSLTFNTVSSGGQQVLTAKQEEQSREVTDIFYSVDGELIVQMPGLNSSILSQGDLLIVQKQQIHSEFEISLYNRGDSAVHLIRGTIHSV